MNPTFFLVLDARKCWMKIFFWNKFRPTPSNMTFFFFYEMLNKIGAFKRMQYFAQRCEFRMVDEMLEPFKSALRLLKLKAPRQNLTMFLIEMSNTYYIKKRF